LSQRLKGVLAGQWFDAGLHREVQAFAHHSLRRTTLSKATEGCRVEGPSQNMWYLYITQNHNGSFYTGITEDPPHRFQEHRRGKGGHYTKYNPPKEMLYTEEIATKEQAKKREKQIKRWSRAKKEALIKRDLVRLKQLSVSHD